MSILRYVATINTPGYLPWDDEPPVLETATEAWSYLAEERERAEDDGSCDETCDEGPACEWGYTHDYSETLGILRQLATGEDVIGLLGVDTSSNLVGSVSGDTPGYHGDHDLGLVYSVSEVTTPGEFKPAEGELLRLLTSDNLSEEDEDYLPNPLDTEMRDGVLFVFVPAHRYLSPSGNCVNCGLLPLDWDSIETPCERN